MVKYFTFDRRTSELGPFKVWKKSSKLTENGQNFRSLKLHISGVPRLNVKCFTISHTKLSEVFKIAFSFGIWWQHLCFYWPEAT